jgi:hypothetical protein
VIITNTSDTPDDQGSLPDNLPECHKLIKDLRAEVKHLATIADTVNALQQKVAELEKQLRRRNRMVFGQRSAKVPTESLTGTGKAVYDNYKAELDEEQRNLQLVPDEKLHGGGGRNIPGTGVTEQIVEHKITDAAILACPCCGNQRKVFGFNPSCQLDIIKTVFKLLKQR